MERLLLDPFELNPSNSKAFGVHRPLRPIMELEKIFPRDRVSDPQCSYPLDLELMGDDRRCLGGQLLYLAEFPLGGVLSPDGRLSLSSLNPRFQKRAGGAGRDK